MILADVNVLVYAYREEAPRHPVYGDWLERVVNGDEAFAVSDLVLNGFLRVVTHPRVFSAQSLSDHAVEFGDALRANPSCTRVTPGARHWEIFARLCRGAGVKGNLVPDAFLAALAIEHGCEWITTDRDYSRFPSVRWRQPTA